LKDICHPGLASGLILLQWLAVIVSATLHTHALIADWPSLIVDQVGRLKIVVQ